MLDIVITVIAAVAAIALLIHRARKSECHSVGKCSACPHAQQCVRAAKEVKTLDRLLKGDRFSIVDVLDDEVRCQLVRFGVEPGQPLYCDYVLPGGPIIVKRGRQQIAIGRSLAERVRVEVQQRDEA